MPQHSGCIVRAWHRWSAVSHTQEAAAQILEEGGFWLHHHTLTCTHEIVALRFSPVFFLRVRTLCSTLIWIRFPDPMPFHTSFVCQHCPVSKVVPVINSYAKSLRPFVAWLALATSTACRTWQVFWASWSFSSWLSNRLTNYIPSISS